MRRLRSFVPALALVLALVVGGETTDTLPCADSDCGAWGVLLDTVPDDGSGAQRSAPAACLCHATFVAAALPSAPAAVTAADALCSAPVTPVGAPARRVPHPPPRG